jgi:hypothetical protein
MRLIGAWFFWAIGDLLSRLPRYPYTLYSATMLLSSDIQGAQQGKYWPWTDAERPPKT